MLFNQVDADTASGTIYAHCALQTMKTLAAAKPLAW
jgi:hypothetical protein